MKTIRIFIWKVKSYFLLRKVGVPLGWYDLCRTADDVLRETLDSFKEDEG